MRNTDTKEKIIELLFVFPTKSFHIREMARILKISPPAVSKAVKQLEKENLLTKEKEIMHKIKANLSNENFKNMKRVYNLKSIYSSGLYFYLKETFPLNTIILFGSYSKGEDTERSDIDIVIDGKERKIQTEDFEKVLNRRINLEFVNFNALTKELRNSIINGIVLQGYISLK